MASARRSASAFDFGPGIAVRNWIVAILVSCFSRWYVVVGPWSLATVVKQPILDQRPTTNDQRLISVPADRALIQIDVSLLGFQIFFDPPWAQLTSEAGLLVATPRRFHIRRLHVVDPHDAGAQRFHRAECLEDVACPDRRREPVSRIVRDLYPIFFVFERDHRGDRPENLFARDAGTVVKIVKDGGFDIVAFGKLLGTSATSCELAFFLSDFLIGADAVVLVLADQWSHFRITIEGGTELYGFGLRGHGIDKFLVDRLLYKNTAARGTDFALINEDAEERAVDGGFKIRVGKENVGRFSAEFESYAFDRIGGLLDDNLPDRPTARECDLVDVGMLHQGRAASLTEASDDVDYAGREANIGQPVRHLQRCNRGLLGRLQHAGAARGQRRRQLPGRHQQRIIPRNDLARDSDRFLECEAHGVVRNRIHISENFCGEAAVVLKAGGDVRNVVFRFNDRLARVAGFQLRQHGRVLANLVCQTEEHSSAFLRCGGRPGTVFKSGFGGSNCAVYVVSIGLRSLRDHFFAGGIVDRKSLV